LLEAADVWDLETITKRVNGLGMLHHDKRVAISQKALEALKG
jgi:predicted chitinase